MSLFKDSKDRYCCRYYTWGAEGKRERVYKTLGLMPYKQAKALYDKLLHESHAPKVALESLTLSQAFECYLKDYGISLAAGTKKGLLGYKKIYLRIFGDIPCNEIS